MSKFKERLGKLSPKKRLYALETLPGHLAESVQGERLHQLLTDFDFIEAKLDAVGVQALIEDYDLARVSDVLLSEGQGETLRLIQGAIRKSAHVLDKDKTQLAGHLWGRLVDFEMPQIQVLVEQAKQSRNSPCLWPLRANLERPREGCLRTLIGHTDRVEAVAIAPDGKTAISASYDYTLKIWDTETGTEVRTLTGHTSWVEAVAIAPDGKTAISASSDETLKIWDTETGTEVRTLTGRLSFVNAVAIAPDGKTAISASFDGSLKIWDTETGTEVRTLIGHTKSVYAVAIAPDGKTAISASMDKTLKIWDIETGTEVRTLTGHTSWVNAVAIAPDGKTAISASYDYTLKIWDTNSGRQLKTLRGHTNSVNAVAIAPNGLTAISASSDNTLKVWDLLSGKEVASFSGDAEFDCCAIAPDGVTVVAGDRSGRVHFLRLEGVSGGR
jgi:WD40 repeat protein